jgi:hypothetical protein
MKNGYTERATKNIGLIQKLALSMALVGLVLHWT